MTIAYNLRTDDSEKTAGRLSPEDMPRFSKAIAGLGISTLICQKGGYNTAVPGDCEQSLLSGFKD